MKDGMHPSGYTKREFKKQTNADRIYSMSVKELAKFLETVENLGYRDESIAGHKDMLEWLQSEVEE